jgi:prepilin-type N-terminal cleavage/methylation domain-containing protein
MRDEQSSMKFFRRPWLRARRGAHRGFTLIELLTVIAIIAVLATLLSAVVSGSKRKARQVTCISNLRQIALGVNLYLDDEQRRPPGFGELVSSRTLSSTNLFNCPEDRAGNWGGKVQPFAGFPSFQPPVDSLAVSYLHSFFLDDRSWERFSKRASAFGLAVCQLHGLGRQDAENPSIFNFEGLIWRGQLDGSVVRRQLFWNRLDTRSLPLESEPAAAMGGDADFAAPPTMVDPVLQLFLDGP